MTRPRWLRLAVHPATRPMRITTPGMNWIGGLAFISVFALVASLLETQDRLIDQREAARLAQNRATVAELRAETLAAAPQIRLEADGSQYRCKIDHVRAEWESAVGRACDDFGRLLIAARAAK